MSASLTFESEGEIISYIIDKENKTLQVASSKTNYNMTPVDWKMLFDKGKEAEQEKVADSLTPREFYNLIITQMAGFGYTLKNVKY